MLFRRILIHARAHICSVHDTVTNHVKMTGEKRNEHKLAALFKCALERDTGKTKNILQRLIVLRQTAELYISLQEEIRTLMDEMFLFLLVYTGLAVGKQTCPTVPG